ncbi:MAG TPA: flagellar motor switch protein FliN [Solirubrobacteraceae bacterium]|nr:flagellar motor switch protein FliN [Solirubrobacteraceae bacterium]
MTQDVEYEQFDQTTTQPPDKDGSDLDLSRLSNIPMGLSVEIGRTSMTVAETLALRVGSIVTLERLAGEAVDLLANGTPIARGEVIVVDERFGLHITELVAGQEISASAATGEQATAAAVLASEQDGALADGAAVLEG